MEVDGAQCHILKSESIDQNASHASADTIMVMTTATCYELESILILQISELPDSNLP